MGDPHQAHAAVEGRGFQQDFAEGPVLADLGGHHGGTPELEELIPDGLPDGLLAALEEGIHEVAPQLIAGQAHQLAEWAIGFQDATLVVHQPHGLAWVEPQGQARKLRGTRLLDQGQRHAESLATTLHPGPLLPQPLQLLEGDQAEEQSRKNGRQPGKAGHAWRQQQLGERSGGQGGGAHQGHPQLQLASMGPPVGQVG